MIRSVLRVFFVATVVMLVLVAASGSPGRMRAAQNVLPDAPGWRDVIAALNINTATAIELEGVAGLDYRKIEARKELLACM